MYTGNFLGNNAFMCIMTDEKCKKKRERKVKYLISTGRPRNICAHFLSRFQISGLELEKISLFTILIILEQLEHEKRI